MSEFVVIADEVTCAGFALAGAHTIVPEADELAGVFANALAQAEVVIVTAAYAEHLPRQMVETALQTQTPAFAIIPDLRETTPAPSQTERIRATLGLNT